MRNRLVLGTESVPTVTVSVALRSVSCQLLPITGSTPTPVANVIVVVLFPSTKVELLDESNWTWLAHGAPHSVPGNQYSDEIGLQLWRDVLANSRLELPVSNTTLMV